MSQPDEPFLYGPIVFRRPPNKMLAIYAEPVWTLKEFNELCPIPENPYVVYTGEGKVTDWDHPAFQHQLKLRDRKRWGYIAIKTILGHSVEAIEDWNLPPEERTKPLDIPGLSMDPETWSEAEAKLRAFFPHYEFDRVAHLIDEANALDEDKLEDNLQSFFQIMERPANEKSETSEKPSTNDSELAPDSA